MPNLIKVVTAEWRAQQSMARQPEPMVMSNEQQVEAYHEQSLWGGAMDSIHIFHIYKMVTLIRPGDHVVDLACGSGDLLLKIAQLYSDAQFTGVDLSETMLQSAQQTCSRLGLRNVTFIKDDICQLDQFADSCVDMVLSTLALHQLPDVSLLPPLASAIDRVLRPDGGLYIADFLRLKSRDSVEIFVKDRAKTDPTFARDYYNSLLAAFSRADIMTHLCSHFAHRPFTFRSTHFADFLFYVTNRRPRLPLRDRHYFQRVPWRQISWQGLVEFFMLQTFVSKTSRI